MTIVELGAIGEFVGSIAVLATLVYLAIQTRQTKFAAQSAARHTAAATMNQNSQNAAASTEYVEIISRGMADEELKPAEWLRFVLWMTGMFHVFQQHYLDSEQGLGDERVWAGEARAMKDLLGNPGVAAWWRSAPALPFSDAFIDHVNRVLESAHETDEFRRYREMRQQ